MRHARTPFSNLPYLLSLAGLWAAFFWQYFVPGPGRVTFPAGDFTYQFSVFRDIAFRALAAGHFPLWADCLFAGYPFQADPQSQLFYPPLWAIFGFLRLTGWANFPILALTVEATLHYLIVSGLLFLFLKGELEAFQPSAPPPAIALAALLGSVAFTYGGYLTGYAPLQTAILETVTWLPLVLWSMAKLAAAESPHWGWTTLTALALAVTFFAGHPQTFLFAAYLSAAYFIYRARQAGRPWRWTIVRLAVVFGLVLSLTAVQLLPQAEYLALSNRSTPAFADLSGGFPVAIFLQLLFTDPVWSPLYIGVLPVALAAFAVVGLRRGPTWFWSGVAGVGFLLSLGGQTPLYQLAYWLLPGYRFFRDQERLAMVVSFALAVLSAHGALALVLAARNRTGRLFPALAAGIVLAAALVGWITYTPALVDWSQRAGLLATGVLLALAGLLAIRLPPAPQLFGGVALVAATAVNLWLARTPTGTVPDFDPYPYNPILDPLRADPEPFFRVQDDARMQGHFACGYGFDEWAGITPIRPAAWVAFEAQAPESLRWKLIAMKYLITWKNGAVTREGELPPAERVAQGPAPLGEAKVYRMFEIPRRAWLVFKYHAEPDRAAVFEQIRAPGFDPFAEAVVQVAEGRQRLLRVDGQGVGQVLVEEDWPGHLHLKVTTTGPALLLVSEAYYPGWQASVQGLAAPVVPADGFVQAVSVPAGESSVTLDFQPPWLAVGAVLSCIALVACAAVGALTVRRRAAIAGSPSH